MLYVVTFGAPQAAIPFEGHALAFEAEQPLERRAADIESRDLADVARYERRIVLEERPGIARLDPAFGFPVQVFDLLRTEVLAGHHRRRAVVLLDALEVMRRRRQAAWSSACADTVSDVRELGVNADLLDFPELSLSLLIAHIGNYGFLDTRLPVKFKNLKLASPNIRSMRSRATLRPDARARLQLISTEAGNAIDAADGSFESPRVGGEKLIVNDKPVWVVVRFEVIDVDE